MEVGRYTDKIKMLIQKTIQCTWVLKNTVFIQEGVLLGRLYNMKEFLHDEMLEDLCFSLFSTSCAPTAVLVGQEHPTVCYSGNRLYFVAWA